MAIARLQVRGPRPTPTREDVDDAVELYQRTSSPLLRSSGETRLRVLEPSHRAMGSSLHPLADSDDLDLGAFLYAIRRLPAGIVRARRIVMGQEPDAFARAGVGPLDEWQPVEAPARRRRWYDGGGDTLAVLLASESDVDDLVPTLVAMQIEWNKINQRMRAAGWPDDDVPDPDPEDCAATLGGAMEDWLRLRDAWGEAFGAHLREIAARRESLRVRMLGGTQVGYARITRRWWAPVRARMVARQLEDRPIYFVSSNTHSLSNLVTGLGRQREEELLAHVDGLPESDGLRGELQALRDGRSEGSWDNLLYYVAREWIDAGGAELRDWRRVAEAEAGVEHLPSATAMRVPAQLIALDRLDVGRPPPRPAGGGGPGPAPRPGRPGWRPPRPARGGGRGGRPPAAPRRDRQRRLPARPRGIQHPARGRGRREHAARGLRPRQGRDAERRRRRRDDLERRARRAQRHDVLARQRLQRRGHRARPALRDRPRQPARGDREEHVPAEPLLPGLLLPRGVHGRRDGGRAVLQRGLRDLRRRSLPGGRRGELLEAPDRLRRHPLRLGHAVHAGSYVGRPRTVLLRDGLDVRGVARDPPARAAARGGAALTGFSGFPPAAFRWFRGLEADNSRPWFQAHRDTYERDVRGPLDAMLAELADELGGEIKLFRQHRD